MLQQLSKNSDTSFGYDISYYLKGRMQLLVERKKQLEDSLSGIEEEINELVAMGEIIDLRLTKSPNIQTTESPKSTPMPISKVIYILLCQDNQELNLDEIYKQGNLLRNSSSPKSSYSSALYRLRKKHKIARNSQGIWKWRRT